MKIEIDPTEAGFAPERLARIDRHFQGYLDQEKLAGWHIALSRRGQLVHSSTAGHRDLETGAQAPRPSTLQLIAEALGCSWEEFRDAAVDLAGDDDFSICY